MEVIHTDDEQIVHLVEYLRILGNGHAVRSDYDRFAAVLSTADALSVNAAIHTVVESSFDIDAWKIPVARFIRATAQSVEAASLPQYPAGHLLEQLESENTKIQQLLTTMQTAAREESALPVDALREILASSDILTKHYQRLQNELFPLFEKSAREHGCVKLMWAIQDDVIAFRRTLLDSQATAESNVFLKTFGQFYLNAGTLAWRERYILYPVVFRMVSPKTFSPPLDAQKKEAFTSRTGSLTNEQLDAIFSLLPVDFSFIDADDRVAYYSDPPHRIFPRSPAIIGRLVQNCHPPKSVSAVEQILESFKSGTEDRAEFWLTIKGRFVHIQYFAVRSKSGAYIGTLEVSQDATKVRALAGEKRLL